MVAIWFGLLLLLLFVAAPFRSWHANMTANEMRCLPNASPLSRSPLPLHSLSLSLCRCVTAFVDVDWLPHALSARPATRRGILRLQQLFVIVVHLVVVLLVVVLVSNANDFSWSSFFWHFTQQFVSLVLCCQAAKVGRQSVSREVKGKVLPNWI